MFHSKRKLYILLITVFCICLVLGSLASCTDNPGTPDDTKPPVDGVDYGIDNVYYTVNGDTEYTFTIVKNTFTITGLNGEQKGTFTYKDGALTLTFASGDSTKASATIENGVLKLTYNGQSYRMLQKKQFTVTFNTAGGSEIAKQEVLNGKYASKPQDPVKDGYLFVGWYADEDYKELFSFETKEITADTTVYARFVANSSGKAEYTVSLVCDGMVFEPVKTVNGVLYNLPVPTKEGAEFAGWWMSDYQSAEKLSRQYTDQVLTQDMALYAVFKTAGTPLVSVGDNEITWQALGATVSYRITIMKGNETVAKSNVGTNSFKFDFSAQEAGEYTVTVECNGKSSTAYVKNKVLDRVSNFRVVNGVLLFDPVAHAEKYLITVKCGNPSHNHTNVDNGTSTNYMFSFCDMPETGIVFAVTAKADGYLDSTQTFTYFLGLDSVKNVKFENGQLVWDAVENAAKYLVEISVDGTTYTSEYVVGGTSYKVDSLNAGAFYAKVTPVAEGYYTAPATAQQFTKKTLAVPSGITITGNTLSWNAVNGAVAYKVDIDGKVYDAATNSIALSSVMLTPGKVEFSVKVMAVGASESENSPYSEAVALKLGTMGSVGYNNGEVVWDPVLGAAKYFVKIGDKTFEVAGDKNSFTATFESAGNVTVSVCFADTNGNKSDWVSTSVQVYAIEFDANGGGEVATLYKAVGDPLTLPVAVRGGYDFVGWFTTATGAAAGKPYEKTVYDVADNTLLYADWTEKSYTITLVPDENVQVTDTTAKVLYGKLFTLETAKHNDTSKVFAGWYSEPNGGGIKYTDENGAALTKWSNTSDIKLYPFFIDALKYELNADGKSYSVAKGDLGIGNVSSLKIPAYYNGKPITTINSAAFVSCTTLKEIYIPDTVTYIEVGTDGINGTGSAFQSCSYLNAINIYPVDGAVEVLYESNDGVLYYHNPFTGFELKAVPYAKTGVLKIMEGAEILPDYILKYSKVTEVMIPYTVKQINSNAFYSLSNLVKVTFLATPSYATERPLEMESKAFYSCSSLTELMLPARLSVFNPDTIQSCSNLAVIDIEDGGAAYSTKGEEGRKVLCTADGRTLVYCPKGMSGSFTIPQGITVIGERAFEGCKLLDTVTISDAVSTISKEAFKSCSALQTLNLGGKDGAALTICEGAFYSCSGLMELTLPERLVKMEVNAFGDTSNLLKVTVNAAGLVPDGAPEGTDPSVDFATNAFGTTKTTPSFYVTNVVIGKDVPVFDIPGVFGQKIENVTVDSENKNYSSVDGVLFDKAITKVVYYPTSRVGEYVLPNTVTELGDRVFQAKTGLTGITIGSNVRYIGINAFYGCSALKFVKFVATPDGETAVPLEIDEAAFKSCSALQSIELPVRLVSIGKQAFMSCSKITEVVIPEGVTKIGESAFASCSSLSKVSLPSTVENMSVEGSEFTVFASCNALATLTVSDKNNYYATIDNVLYQKSEVKGEDDKVSYVPTNLLFCPRMKAGSTDIVVPDSVSVISPKAFEYNKVVTSITFGKLADGQNLTIGQNAFFYCNTLTKITLPEGLTQIAEKMFYQCTSIEEIVIPSTVELIGNQAFYYCTALNKLTFAPTPEGKTPVELIIADAKSYSYAPFYNCKALKEIVLPERLTVIGSYAFGGGYTSSGGGEPYYSYAYIESVTLPSTLKRIGDYAFYYATSLKSVKFAEGIALEDVISGGKITASAIGKYAFAYCKALTSFEFPTTADSTYSLGNYAFAYGALLNVSIPTNITSLGDYCFYNSTSITNIEFAKGANPAIGKSAFAYTSIESIALPEGITAIGDYAFQYCKKLKTITIPLTVKSIGTYAFGTCESLTTIVFETAEDGTSNVSKIADRAFQYTALKSFVFPTLAGDASLQLGAYLFNSCKELDSVYISKSVGNLTNVFSGCNSIKNFVVDPESENFSAKSDGTVGILYNKEGTAYKYICGQLTGEHIIPVGVTEISAEVFKGQIGLVKVVIPYTVKIIGKSAFESCSSLTTVVFEHSAENPSQLQTDSKGLTDLGDRLFAYCYSLENVSLPANMTRIPNYMFWNCASLESITLPGGLVQIGNDSFEYTALKSVTIPATVTTIGNNAFSSKSGYETITSVVFEKDENGNCALTSIGNVAFKYQKFPSIVIPKSVTNLGNNSFSYNPELTSFTFEEGTKITSFGTSLIRACTKIESFTVPKSVTTLGELDFANCTALTSVVFEEGSKLTVTGTSTFKESGIVSIVFPESLVFVGTTSAKAPTINTYGNLFEKCASLKSVTFGSKTTHLAGKMFLDCTALETVTIPDTVTMICAYTFQNCTSLKTVNFGENSKLNALGAYAFAGSGLESIVIPKGVTVLGTSATAATVSSYARQFQGCQNLKSVEFKGNLKLLGGYVFQECTSLTLITLPATVTQIGNYCFDSCTSLETVDIQSTGSLTIGTYAFQKSGLKSITIPAKTSSIGNYAFAYCPNLEEVKFPASTTKLTLGTYCFRECTSLADVALPDRLTAISDYAFYDCTGLSSITFNKVTSIGKQAFRYCESLKSIVLPEGLTALKQEAFLQSGLESINIPKTCNTIGINVFGYCHDLATITVTEGNLKYKVMEGALVTATTPAALVAVPGTTTGTFYVSEGMSLGAYALNGVKGITEIVLLDGITEIPNYAFFGAGATKITIPASVTKIGAGAFQYSSITSVEIPAGVTEIGNNAFNGCSDLASITFADDSELELLGTYAFAGTAISEITLPKKITKLGSTVYIASFTFKDCANLSSVTFLGEMESLNGSAFRNCTSLKSFTIPDTVRYLGSYVFAGSGLESIVIPGKTLTSLYESSTSTTYTSYTFQGCASLKSVVIEEGITYINGNAFENCTALESIQLPSTVTTIDTKAFNGCSALKSVTIPANVTKLGNNVFTNCTSLETVTFEEGSQLATLGNSVFSGSGLVSIVLPKGITKLPSSTFSGCVNLSSVSFLGDLTRIESSVFLGCTSLESIELPDTLEYLGATSFKQSGLKSVYIPASVTSSNSSVFEGCEQLESVVFAEGVDLIGSSTFKNCINLKSVKLSSTTERIYASAFEGCTALKQLFIPNTVTSVSAKAFLGWTAEQTLLMQGDKASCAAWTSTWDEGCDAVIVYEAKAE